MCASPVSCCRSSAGGSTTSSTSPPSSPSRIYTPSTAKSSPTETPQRQMNSMTVMRPRRSDRGLSLGNPPLRRRLGRHRPDYLVLVLAVLQHRHVLSGARGPGGRDAWDSDNG